MPSYENMGANTEAGGINSNAILDFRSDTVTRPCAGMREAMATARVGDDVYGEDPTVNELERFVADLLGKEAGLFLSSGTQSNLTSLLAHCGRGEEYIGGDIYHISKYEAAGAAVLGSISPRHLQVDSRGGLTAPRIKAAINPDNSHFAATKLVCLENTVKGQVQDQAEINAIAEMAHANNLSVHLDGARLMNAVVASKSSARVLVEKVDTVSLCLSKGLGAPVGSVLCGPANFIHRARYIRKMLGGGMRQAGILAAGGLYAIKHNVERLTDDHNRAGRLGEALARIDGIDVDLSSVNTNMVFASAAPPHQKSLHEYLLSSGILLDCGDHAFRIVTHLDIDDAAIDRLVEAIEAYFSSVKN